MVSFKQAANILSPWILFGLVRSDDLLQDGTIVEARSNDRFNYGETDFDNDNFGTEDWDLVGCGNVRTCVSVCGLNKLSDDSVK
jgi:hypothetical protein